MSSAQASDIEALETRIKDDLRIHARSSSTTSSSHSSLSRDSTHQPVVSTPKSPKLGHKKTGSLTKFFAVKEPSLNAFEQLADLQQKELAQKRQRIPFGVPNAKLPDTVKDDYKKAKQRARERAKMHEAVKEKVRQQEQTERRRHEKKASISDPIATEAEIARHDFYHRATSPPSPKPFSSPKPGTSRTTPRRRRPPSLDSLPEMPSFATAASPQDRFVFPPSPPPSQHSRSSSSTKIAGVLTGTARKDALPWE